jgi:hypothetical protein
MDGEVGQIEAWVGLDVGKADHHATVVSAAGEPLFELAVRNDEAAIERLLDLAGEVGRCAFVIDQPGSIGSLAVCLARRRGVPVAYVPGLVMRRASELYPGEAKTDRRDSFVLADTAPAAAPTTPPSTRPTTTSWAAGACAPATGARSAAPGPSWCSSPTRPRRCSPCCTRRTRR